MKALQITNLDLIIIILITLSQILLGVWVSYKNKGTENYFAGGRSLKWYTITGAIFGTNISALHLVGMLGIGYSVGFAQSHFELLAIFAILILAFVFVPLYRKIKIFTLSQFLEIRFNSSVRLTYSVMMLLLILVQTVASFYIGARSISLLTKGSEYPLTYETGIFLQAIVIGSYTMFGGLRAVMITESFQTIFIILAAFTLYFLTFSQPEINGFAGLMELERNLPVSLQKMHLYLPSNDSSLPWTGVFSGLMILHFFYWNSNQFIVQRVIAAESNKDAQLGVLGAGFLKLLIPFLTISTGVAAAHLFRLRYNETNILPDDAFLFLVDTVVPNTFGLTGLILAGVAAAVFSTIEAMMNASSTLFTMDIYKKYLNKESSDKQLLFIGRITVLIMIIAACFLAIYTYNPSGGGNFFLTVSSRGSYFTPGIIVAFFGGIIFRNATSKGALLAIITAPLFAFGFEWLYNECLIQNNIITALWGNKLNFLHRVFISSIGSLIVFLLCLKNNQQNTDNKLILTLPTTTLKKITIKLAVFLTINLIISVSVIYQVTHHHYAAIIASLFTIPVFLFNSSKPYFSIEATKLFAAFLLAITVFILYWFW